MRLQGYDYATAGAYFVTICVERRDCLFGEIADDAVILNDVGLIVHKTWNDIPIRYPTVLLDEFVVMPNHVHGILILDPPLGTLLAASRNASDAASSVPTYSPAAASSVPMDDSVGELNNSRPSIPRIMRAFKSISAIAANRMLGRSGIPLWQERYYDRVIRDEDELNRIRLYIHENPARWALDKENPFA